MTLPLTPRQQRKRKRDLEYRATHKERDRANQRARYHRDEKFRVSEIERGRRPENRARHNARRRANYAAAKNLRIRKAPDKPSKLEKIEAIANDPRGDANIRAIAVATAAKLIRQENARAKSI